MRFLLSIALVVVLSTTQAGAAPSLLGVCHKDWNCKDIDSIYRGFDKIELSWLETTFGIRCTCLQRLLNDARPKIIRAHIINSPCMRNKRCARTEPLWGYTASSASRATKNSRSRLVRRFTKALERFRARISDVNLTCYVSPCLECDLYEDARRTLANLVLAAVPRCNIVDNPYRRRCLSEYTCEKHGDNFTISAPCIVDLDGTDGVTVDMEAWVAKYKHCDLSFYWESWMNCNTANPSQFIPPLTRACDTQPKPLARLREILCQYFYQLSDTCSP